MGPRRSTFVSFAVLCALALCCAAPALALCWAAPALALEPAGDGWYWQLPQPQGHWLNSVAMPDAEHIWAVGSGGTVLASTDGGAGWHRQSVPTSDPLNAVAFTDATHGSVVGGWLQSAFTHAGTRSSVILCTMDAGTTWTAAMQPSEWGLTDVVFTDAQTGVAVGQHGTILRTIDGGQSWVLVPSGTTQDIGAVAFTDAQHGYALANDRFVCRTADGGLTWRTGPAREYYWDFVDGLAADGAGALWTASSLVWDDPGTLLRSTDDGRTWKVVKAGGDYGFWDVAASGARICAVGPAMASPSDSVESSSLAVSQDGGATWTTRLLGRGFVAGAVALGGAQDVCAVGAGTVASRDGGATWAGVGFDPPGVGSLDFVSATEGWSTGGNAWQRITPALYDMRSGSILHTSDGVTWQEQYSHPRVSLLDVDFADADHGWAVGTRGAIRHTSDGGASWSAQAIGKGSSFGFVEAPGPEEAWVLGEVRAPRPHTAFLHTTDGGATWATVEPPTGLWPMTMHFLTGRQGWIAGWDRKGAGIAVTADGGATWSRVRLTGAGGAIWPVALDFVDAMHGWLVGMRLSDSTSVVLRTEDGGASWSQAGGPIDDAIGDVDFVDAQRGWLSGDRVWSTDDGGGTWVKRTERTGYGGSVAAVDATHVWSAAYAYGIISTVDGAGDTAAPTTVSEGDRGWLRHGTTITLGANDGGGSGAASTEYRLDGGAWQPYLAPLEFPAPADHSGDGRHTLEYRSTDAAGLTESIQRCRVDVDTVRPVIRLRPSKVGRDGVLRLHLRIDDAGCSSVEEFELDFRAVHDRRIRTGGEYSGFRLPTNRWFTFIDRHCRIYDGQPRTYRVKLYARDRAGNEPAKVGSALLVVKKRPKKRSAAPVRDFSVTAASVAAGRVAVLGGSEQSSAVTSLPAWLPARVREAVLRLARREVER